MSGAAAVFLAVLSSAPPSVPPLPAAAVARLAGRELLDQHGRPLRLAELHGAPAVVLLVSARRARLLRGWEQALPAPRPALFRVVDVPPGGRAAEVAATLRRRAPRDVRLAVDGDRAFAEALAVDPAEPVVLVLDAELVPRAIVRGRARPDAVATVRAALAAAGGGR
jgi:hypothetical protein